MDKSEALGLKAFFDSLKSPIEELFKERSFTVVAEVMDVSEWKFGWFLKLCEKENGKTYNLTVYASSKVLKESGFEPAPRMKLLVSGTVRMQDSEIRLTATNMADAGIGEMKRLMDKWLKDHEQLFNRLKKPIPELTRRIAVISNSETQGYVDFIRHLKYGEITLFSVPMQGPDVPARCSNAIMEANRQGVYDLICLIRGGGSTEDLFEFSKPELLIAIAESQVPVATAIGHENDFPLCDLAADKRFSTPTDIGKALTEKADSLLKDVLQLKWRLNEGMRAKATEHLGSLEISEERLGARMRQAAMGWMTKVANAERQLELAYGARCVEGKRKSATQAIAGAAVVVVILLIVIVYLLMRGRLL